MPFFIFVIFPLTEIILYTAVGRVLDGEKVLALTIFTSILGIILFRLRHYRKDGKVLFGSASFVPSRINPYLFTLGTLLLIIPGFLTDLLGIMLIIPAGRSLFYKICLRYFREHRASIPFPLNLLPFLFGINVFEDAETGSWEETEPETGPYNGDISHPDRNSGSEDDDIIDVEFTER